MTTSSDRWFKNLFFPPFSEREILILSYVLLLVCLEQAPPVIEGLPAAGRFIGLIFAAGPLGLIVGLFIGFWIAMGIRRLAAILRSLFRMAGTTAPMGDREKEIVAFLFYFTLSGVSLAALAAEFFDARYEVLGPFGGIGEGGPLTILNRAILLFVALRALTTLVLTWLVRRIDALDLLGRQVDDIQITPLSLVWIGLITPAIYFVVRYAYVLPSAVTLVYFYVSEILYLMDRLGRLRRLNRAVSAGLTLVVACGLAAGILLLEKEKAERTLRYRWEEGRAALVEGDPVTAVADLERALEIALRRYGPDDFRTGRLHQRLGSARFATGDLKATIRHHERALAAFGTDPAAHPAWTAESLRYLGLAHLRLSDPDRAAARLSQALAIQEGLAPPNSQAIISLLSDLGAACFAAGEYDAAIERFQTALGTLAALEDPDPTALIRLHLRLGQAHDRMGNIDGMTAAYEAALSHGKGPFEAAVPEPEAVYAQLGLAHYDAGRFQRAARLLERAAARYGGKLRDDHPMRTALDFPLGSALVRSGDIRGVHRLESLLRRAESRLGYDAPVPARLHYEIGMGYDAVGNVRTAVDHLSRALNLWRKREASGTGIDPPPEALGPHYQPSLAGDEAALVALLEKNAEKWLATYGDHYLNQDLALALYHAGVYLAEKGEVGRAGHLLSAALEMQDAAHGPDHPVTRRTREVLER
jgi:tetratricopeptide (TPR) repeat protein